MGSSVEGCDLGQERSSGGWEDVASVWYGSRERALCFGLRRILVDKGVDVLTVDEDHK